MQYARTSPDRRLAVSGRFKASSLPNPAGFRRSSQPCALTCTPRPPAIRFGSQPTREEYPNAQDQAGAAIGGADRCGESPWWRRSVVARSREWPVTSLNKQDKKQVEPRDRQEAGEEAGPKSRPKSRSAKAVPRRVVPDRRRDAVGGPQIADNSLSTTAKLTRDLDLFGGSFVTAPVVNRRPDRSSQGVMRSDPARRRRRRFRCSARAGQLSVYGKCCRDRRRDEIYATVSVAQTRARLGLGDARGEPTPPTQSPRSLEVPAAPAQDPHPRGSGTR